MKPWLFDLSVVVALGLLVFFSVAPAFGLKLEPSPLVTSAFGVLIGLVFTRRDRFTRKGKDDADDADDGSNDDR